VHAWVSKVSRHPLWVEVQVPDEVSIEHVDAESLPAGWAAPDAQVARRFGDLWFEEARLAMLLMPSVGWPRRNAMPWSIQSIPDVARLVVSAPQPVRWNDLGISGCLLAEAAFHLNKRTWNTC
jgi:RES domain-containing protein